MPILFLMTLNLKYNMTPEEKMQKIKEIYDNASVRLEELQKTRKEILKKEINKVEAEEIEKIRKTLLKSFCISTIILIVKESQTTDRGDAFGAFMVVSGGKTCSISPR